MATLSLIKFLQQQVCPLRQDISSNQYDFNTKIKSLQIYFLIFGNQILFAYK